jgi:hypothetical protein
MSSLPAFITIVLMSCVLSARAQISPGKLSRFHESLEGIANCTACHELGKDVSDTKCQTCHTVIKDRIGQRKGYHASAVVQGKACRQCHSEHNGRDYELVHWEGGQAVFDHRVTGFVLQGAHVKQKCRDCHRANFIADESVAESPNLRRERTFLGLGSACKDCHTDEHRTQVSDQCASCHTEEAWSPAAKFSHARAHYTLTGKHAVVACEKCHALVPIPAETPTQRISKKERVGFYTRYSGLAYAQCSDCHRDPHDGRFGPTCNHCHDTEGFNVVKTGAFDHSKTNYPLLGKHAAVACGKCHKSGRMTDPLAYAICKNCHQEAHDNQFAQRTSGGACEDCHTVQGYVPSTYGIEQHAASKYPLTGSHLAVPCNACHKTKETPRGRTANFTFAQTTCQTCHEDAHHGQLDHWVKDKGCEFCHITDTWHRTSFDHRLARFPLEGKHREILCLKCHQVKQAETGQETLWMKPLTMDCSGCHQDIHHEQFMRADSVATVTDCRRCHTAQGWNALTFDHRRDARFVLDGAHEKVACAKCHPRVEEGGASYVRYRPLDMTCRDCHAEKP